MSNQAFTDGDKVKYHTGDSKWKSGVVHGVRKVDDEHGQPRVLSYLVDTGGDERLDVRRRNLKDEALSAEYNKHAVRGASHEQALEKAHGAVKHLKDEIVEETFRQPEMVDVKPDHIKAA